MVATGHWSDSTRPSAAPLRDAGRRQASAADEGGVRAGNEQGARRVPVPTGSGEVQRRAMQLATILEPLLIVTMGAVVMLIVLAVMLPIIQLNQFVR